MFFFLWIFAIIVCFVITLFPIRVEDSINKRKDVLFFVEKFVEYLLIACTYVLIVSNRTHDDMRNYQYSYIGAVSHDSSRETLYSWLSSLSYDVGLNFFQFREIMVLVCGGCCIAAIKKADIKVSSVLLFFMPVILFMDSIQFRNSICLYVLLFAVHLLGNIRSAMLFVVIVLLLSQIHSAFYFYLLLSVMYVNENKKNVVLGWVVGVSLVLCMLTFLNGNRILFMNDVLTFFLSSSDSRIANYSTSGKFGFLYPTFVHSVTLIFLCFLKKRVFLIPKDDIFVKNIIGLMACSYVVVPFVMMNMNYYRILRNAYVASVLAFMVVFRELKNDALGKIFLFAGLIVIACLWGFFILGIYNPMNEILDPVLKDGVWFLDNETGVLR
ncbi:EpsG family protein [Fibrobacter sp. HC4]|uniref:EpsG family protein n=1 Tax=Fibrobacter sp. HC4 TaxID=3239812 RepID=UPI00201967EA|nr:EpsG family protein [Fibrobacter succinogenes]MCL4103470.1 hypothetical protein [Fibrobacter succinogenes]